MRTRYVSILPPLFAMHCCTMLQPTMSQTWNNIATIYGDYYEDFSGSAVRLNTEGNSIAIQSFAQGSRRHGKMSIYSSNGNGTWVETYERQFGLDSLTARVQLDYSGDGSTLAVGTHYNVTLYELNVTDGAWMSLKGPIESDNFYSTVMSLDLSYKGDVLALSSYSFGKSSYRIFRRNNNGQGWENMGEPISSSLINTHGIVSMSGNGRKVAISEILDRGITRIFEYNESSAIWEQMGDSIVGNSDGDLSGKAMALSRDGLTVVIGAPFHDEMASNETKLNVGSVNVYRYDTELRQWKRLGESLKGKKAFCSFGNSLDISGDGSILAVGNSDGLQRDQYVSVFQFMPETGVWVQLGNDLVSDGSLKSYYGFSISLSDDGSMLAIGSPGATKPRNLDENITFPLSNAGAVLIYKYENKQSQILVDTLITSGATSYRVYYWDVWPTMSIIVSTLFLLSFCC